MAIVRSTFDPAKAKGLSSETEARMAAMTQEEIEANALSDPDNPPSTDEELARGLFGRRVRRLREKLGLSQKEFAEQFDINLRRLQDWEQGRFAPDSVALAYLRVIEQAPDMVRRILQAV
jgi:putative transcriptional regulator